MDDLTHRTDAAHPEADGSIAGSHRRHFLWKGLLAFFAGLIGKTALAEAGKPDSSLTMEGEVMHTGVYKGRPPIEPLDTMIRFERSDDNNGRAMTHEILSLIHEEKGANSYPWTIYAGLATHHVQGDACVMCSRLHKHGAGWSSGLHSEVYNHARAVALGVNIEMTNLYAGPDSTHMIGLNIQMLPGNPMQMGIQVHGEGQVEKGIGLNGKGDVGLDLGGKYGTGINTHGNTIRLNEGTCIELDGEGKIRMRYQSGRIEFLNGEKVVGHLSMSGEDHSL
jgi:hypothetical protein